MAQIVNFDGRGNPDLGIPIEGGRDFRVPSGDGA